MTEYRGVGLSTGDGCPTCSPGCGPGIFSKKSTKTVLVSVGFPINAMRARELNPTIVKFKDFDTLDAQFIPPAESNGYIDYWRSDTSQGVFKFGDEGIYQVKMQVTKVETDTPCFEGSSNNGDTSQCVSSFNESYFVLGGEVSNPWNGITIGADYHAVSSPNQLPDNIYVNPRGNYSPELSVNGIAGLFWHRKYITATYEVFYTKDISGTVTIVRTVVNDYSVKVRVAKMRPTIWDPGAHYHYEGAWQILDGFDPFTAPIPLAMPSNHIPNDRTVYVLADDAVVGSAVPYEESTAEKSNFLGHFEVGWDLPGYWSTIINSSEWNARRQEYDNFLFNMGDKDVISTVTISADPIDPGTL